MKDERKTKQQLLDEIRILRERVAGLDTPSGPGVPGGACAPEADIYRMLVENTVDIIWTTDNRHRYTYITPSCETMLGFAPAEGLGRHILLRVAPESRARAREAFYMVSDGAAEESPDFHTRVELEHYNRDGSRRWLEVIARPIFDGQGNRIGLQGVSRDIHERKRTEERLQRLDAKFRNVLENASLLGVSVDTKGRITFINDQFLLLTGHKRADILDRDWFDTFVPADARAPQRHRFLEAMSRGRLDGATRHETELLTRTGNRITVLWSNVIDFGQDDRPAGTTGLGVDVTRIRRTQTELARSELRYRRLFEDAALGIFVTEGTTDEDWTIIDLNKAGQALLGYSRDEFIGRHPAEIIHPEDLSAMPLSATLSRPETGEPMRLERRYLRKDGTWLPAQVTLKRIPGTRQHLVMFQDTSESKQAKAALQEFRVLLTSMADNMLDMLWAKDLNGRFLFANKAFRDNLLICDGIDPLGKTDVFFAKRQREMGRMHTFGELCVNSDQVVLDSMRPGRFLEDGLVRGEYLVLDVQKSPLFDASGVCIGTVGTGRDITEQRRAEEALLASERELQLTLDAVNDSIWSYDVKNDAFKASPKILSMLGFDPGEATPQSRLGEEGVHPADLRRRNSRLADYLAGRSPEYTAEFRMRTKSGGWRWIYSRGSVVERDGTGAPLRVIGAHTDITELKKVQEDLIRAKELAEHATKVKSEFLANMSHELRTPLNGIFGMLQLMQTTPMNGEQLEYVETAMTTGRSLLAIINDVLDFSKLEAGQDSVERAPFTLRHSLETVVQNFRVMAAEKGISLHLDMIGAIPPRLTGDNGRLRQVLFNLVGNAVKFCDRGEVAIEVSALPNTRRSEDVRLLFRVRDTGIGIPDEQLMLMFEAFTQVDGAYTRRYAGTGLGLGIVRRLVTNMGGTLSVDSRVGRGTSVYFSLPFGLDKTAAAVPRRTGELQPPLGALHVLLVEDEHVNQMATRIFLGKHGHTVQCADNGIQALEFLTTQRFDCVLMDVQMPEMDGLTATRAIRSSGAPYADVPIIAMTAHAMEGDRNHFLKAGMNGYLAKPVDLDDLERQLAKVMIARERERM